MASITQYLTESKIQIFVADRIYWYPQHKKTVGLPTENELRHSIWNHYTADIVYSPFPNGRPSGSPSLFLFAGTVGFIPDFDLTQNYRHAYDFLVPNTELAGYATLELSTGLDNSAGAFILRARATASSRYYKQDIAYLQAPYDFRAVAPATFRYNALLTGKESLNTAMAMIAEDLRDNVPGIAPEMFEPDPRRPGEPKDYKDRPLIAALVAAVGNLQRRIAVRSGKDPDVADPIYAT